ncbi:MAG: aldo/keto reductase [Burkholderiaceae bacterium]|nr:aldo/keto reductase [Burkholderiaceae bacterium]
MTSQSWQPDPDRFTRQPYPRCGRSGLRPGAIALGLWHNFGAGAGTPDEAQARSLLRQAIDQGIVHFDLANNYGPPPGAAESLLGRALKTDLHGLRDELVISTKAGYVMGADPHGDGGSRKYLLTSLDQSLRRLQLDHVDIFYHHRPDPHTPLEETMAVLDQAVRSGRALYVGLSNYPADLLRRAAALLRQLGTPCVIHQPRYHLLERGPEQGLLDALVDEGIGCIPFSPLAQGLLSDRYLDGRIPADSRAAGASPFLRPDMLTDERLARARALQAIAAARGQPLAGMALRWLLQRPAVCSVLIGASRAAQIREAVAAVQAAAFSDEELAAIDRAALGPLDGPLDGLRA